MAAVHYSRGDIWDVDLTLDRTGHEIDKQRPAIIVTTDHINRLAGGMVAVVPVTDADGKLRQDGRTPKYFHQVLLLAHESNGLKKTSIAATDQVRTVDKSRLKQKLGKVTNRQLEEISNALCFTFDLFAKD